MKGTSGADAKTEPGVTNGNMMLKQRTLFIITAVLALSCEKAAPSRTPTPIDSAKSKLVSSSIASLTIPRSQHTATLLPSGKVLLVGGLDSGGTAVATAELFDPSTGLLSPTASLTTARAGHVAVLLPSGDVLIVGGSNTSGPLTSAERYSPLSGTWSAAGAMSQARTDATATLLSSGAVLIAGGAEGLTNPGEIFSPSSNTWAPTGAPALGRTRHAATLLSSGQVLIAGGERASTPLSEVFIYDALTDTWSAANAMATARTGHSATVLSGGDVLVVGGADGTGPLTSTERFNPGTGLWAASGPLNVGRRLHSATRLPSGNVLVAGGVDTLGAELASLELYDANAGTFAPAGALSAARAAHTATLLPSGQTLIVGGTGTPVAPTMVELIDLSAPSWSLSGPAFAGRRGATTTVLPNGKVLMVGGIDFAGGYLALCELYDPTAGTWALTGSLSGARAYHTATLLPSGKVLVTGGYAGPVSVVSTVELYEPTTGVWSFAGVLLAARAEHTATLISGNQVLIAGGRDGNATELSSAELFNALTGSLSATAPLAAARHAHSATLLRSGDVLIAGGEATGFALASSELYQPSTQTWTTVGAMGTARAHHTAVVLESGEVLVAGGQGLVAPLASVELFRPGLNTWVAAGTLTTARTTHTAAVLPSGLVLFSGGNTGLGSSTSVERYDVATRISTPVANLSVVRAEHNTLLLPNGLVMAVNGAPIGPSSTVVEHYDEGREAPLGTAPSLSGPLPQRTPGGPLNLTGLRFTATTEGSSGHSRSSPTMHPLVRIERANGEAAAYLPVSAFTSTSVTATLPPSLLTGWYWARVVTQCLVSNAEPFLVLPSIVLSPGSTPPQGTLVFTATGGAGSYSWSLATNASGGTIDPVNGVYRAGPTGSVIDVVQVTDSSGNVATTTVTVGPGVSLAPATVAPRQTLTLVATGGSGDGYAWSIITAGAGGVIGATTGTYQAPATSGVDVIRVIDSLGNEATANITVGPGISITPPLASVLPRGTVSFSATGGLNAGFTWSLATNLSGGTIDPSSGAYAAGPTGNVADVVEVIDPLGNTATATVTVGAGITVTPAIITLPPRGSTTFAATGGVGSGYIWSLGTNASGGTINASTGEYVAGSSGSTSDVVFVTDALGNLGAARVTVTAGVSILPSPASTPPRGSLALTASGGSEVGFQWALTTNRSGGTIDSLTGAYQAGSTGGVVDVVTATDSLGNVAQHNVTVGPGLSITPSNPSVPLNGSVTFTAFGGSGTGLAWALISNGSGATIDAANGTYRAGTVPNATDVIEVVDSLGNRASVTVTVGPNVSISPNTSTVAPRGSSAFTAMGGTGSGYVWSFVTNASGGNLNASTGAYIAGPLGNVVDMVQVQDALGNTATATINVSAGITVSPASASSPPQGTLTFTATGGAGSGCLWSLVSNGSGGSIDVAGLYRAGPTGSATDVVQVQDGLGNTATASVTVTAGLVLQASSVTTPPKGSLSFSASGGAGQGYVFSLVTNASQGSIDAATGAYLAGAIGDVTDTVQLTDALGNVATVEVHVTAAVSITDSISALSPGESYTFAAAGGSGTGYRWALLTNASQGTIDAATGAYTAGSTGGVVDVVQVTDSLGNTAEVSVKVWPAWSVAGSGCSAVDGPSLAALGLALGLIRLRRRRVTGAFVAALTVGASLTAQAQSANSPTLSTAVVMERFAPKGGAFDVLSVESAQVAGHLGWSVSLFGSYADRPFRLVAPDQQSVLLLERQATASLGGSIALFERFEMAVMMPVTFAQSSQKSDNVPPALQPAIASGGLSDLRLTPKVKLFELGGFRMAVLAPVTAPTGRTDSWLGAGGWTVGPRATLEWHGVKPLRVLASGGYLVRPQRQLVDIEIGNAVTYGVAAEVMLKVGTQELAALGTVAGEYGLASPKPATRPLELLAGLRWRGPMGFGATVGGGTGISAGYGNPGFRVFAALSVTPDWPEKRAAEPLPPTPIPAPVITPVAPVVETPPAPEPAPVETPATVAPKPRTIWRVQFVFNRAELGPKARLALREIAAELAKHPNIAVRIDGHADELGPENVNDWLADQRANNVRAFLIMRGVSPSQLEVAGYGNRVPIDTSRTKSGAAKNRRVEISIETPDPQS